MTEISKQKTLKSLAHSIGVSATTVSRVLSGQARKYRISKQTEEVVLAEAARVDYAPNQVAKSLRLQKTNTLGLIVPDIANPFFGTLARHIESEAKKTDYSIILCDSNSSTIEEIEALRLLESRNVDGIIVSPVGQVGSHFEELYNKRKPIVVVDRYFEGMKLPYVTSDNYKASYEAVEYLIDNGHTNIACIQGLSDCLLNSDRANGYRDALKDHGLSINEVVVGNSFTHRNGYIETKLLLKSLNRPTAIYALGSSISFGAYSAIDEEGLSIPNDISLISFDEQPYFPFLATPLTAVAQQNEAMGELAVKMIMNQIESKNDYESQGVKLATRLNIRKSVRKI